MLLLILICIAPGELWLDALVESHWAVRNTLQLSSDQISISLSGVLPDPMLQLSLAGSPVETRNGPILGSIGFQQKIPWPGLLSASRNRAAAGYLYAQEMKLQTDLVMRTAVTQFWTEVYRLQRREVVLAERATYLSSLLASAAGASSTFTVEHSALADLRIRVALANQKPLLERNSLIAACAGLNSVTGSNTELADELPPLSWFNERISAAVVCPPALRVASASIESAAAELSRTEALFMPDFTIGGTYSLVGYPQIAAGAVSPGSDSWMVSLGISLPFGYAGDRTRINAAELALAAAREHHIQMKAEIDAELHLYAVSVQNSVDELNLLYQLLPVSEAAVFSTSGAWIA
ncbi:MAG: TolC family protein, partial [bacterium]|nr:TolC family protein [bacterium]